MNDFPEDNLDRIIEADALAYLAALPAESINCIVTSPPYFGLRDYGTPDQIGLEATPQEYVARLAAVFEEARRVLRSDGVLWLNIGDSFGTGSGGDKTSSSKQQSSKGTQMAPRSGVTGMNKSLLGIPWRVAFALQDAGWILRMDCIWHKPSPMPESVTDRPTKAHEYVFLFSKSPQYWYDAEAVSEISNYSPDTRTSKKRGEFNGKHGSAAFRAIRETRNLRSVWTIATEATPFAHFATMPSKLAKRCILAGCPVEGIVLDMFSVSGTTALAARNTGRHFAGCDSSAEYVELANKRLALPYTVPMFS